jgi:hypothetical protein
MIPFPRQPSGVLANNVVRTESTEPCGRKANELLGGSCLRDGAQAPTPPDERNEAPENTKRLGRAYGTIDRDSLELIGRVGQL